MAVICRLPGGEDKTGKQAIVNAVGTDTISMHNKLVEIAGVVTNAKNDIREKANSKGASIPQNPTLKQIVDGLNNVTHFTQPQQISGFVATVGHQTSGLIDLHWIKPTIVTNFSGTRIVYKAGGYPTTPTDGYLAYDGAGTSAQLSGLTNGTVYYFRAFAYNYTAGAYVYNTNSTGAQCTGTPTLLTSVQITGLNAMVGFTVQGQMILSWSNPIDVKFKGVRIIYKTGGYPTSVADGTLLYDGTGVSLTKTGLVDGTTYYIRAFAYNLSNGVYSYNTEAANCAATPYMRQGKQVFTSTSQFVVPPGVTKIDIFVVGGGSAGGWSSTASSQDPYYNIQQAGGGGAGGCTNTITNVKVTQGQVIAIIVGAGGTSSNINVGDWGSMHGGTSSAVLAGVVDISARGGHSLAVLPNNYNHYLGANGANGGSGGGVGRSSTSTNYCYTTGKGGSDGRNGWDAFREDKHDKEIPDSYTYSQGQKVTTREFGELTNTLYAGGGGAGATTYSYTYMPGAVGGTGGGGSGGATQKIQNTGQSNGIKGDNGAAGTGGGGGGTGYYLKSSYDNYLSGGDGGSGVVIVRWGY